MRATFAVKTRAALQHCERSLPRGTETFARAKRTVEKIDVARLCRCRDDGPAATDDGVRVALRAARASATFELRKNTALARDVRAELHRAYRSDRYIAVCRFEASESGFEASLVVHDRAVDAGRLDLMRAAAFESDVAGERSRAQSVGRGIVDDERSATGLREDRSAHVLQRETAAARKSNERAAAIIVDVEITAAREDEDECRIVRNRHDDGSRRRVGHTFHDDRVVRARRDRRNDERLGRERRRPAMRLRDQNRRLFRHLMHGPMHDRERRLARNLDALPIPRSDRHVARVKVDAHDRCREALERGRFGARGKCEREPCGERYGVQF